jgi:transposase-like protein
VKIGVVRDEEGQMPKKRHSAEEVITKLREAEVLQSRGQSLVQVCKALGVTQQTYYRWRKEYGGLKIDQAKRLKVLEKENSRLKKVVADQALDISILKEVAEGNF